MKQDDQNNEEFDARWEVYPSHLGDDFAMIAVNVSPVDSAPFDNLRWLNIVRLRFDAQKSGMPVSAENERLDAIAAFAAQQVEGRGGVQVGRLTVAGRRELFLYAATNESEVLLAELEREFDGVELETQARLDAQWRVYFDLLYPTPLDFQRIHNQRVVHLLAQNGDNPSIPRRIDHFAFFPDPQTRDRFRAEIIERGFTVDEEDVSEAEEGERRFLLAFHSVGPVDLGSIDQLTIPLFLRADELGGVYDGWGCEVQAKS